MEYVFAVVFGSIVSAVVSIMIMKKEERNNPTDWHSWRDHD
jgi:hypothetical protein